VAFWNVISALIIPKLPLTICGAVGIAGIFENISAMVYSSGKPVIYYLGFRHPHVPGLPARCGVFPVSKDALGSVNRIGKHKTGVNFYTILN